MSPGQKSAQPAPRNRLPRLSRLSRASPDPPDLPDPPEHPENLESLESLESLGRASEAEGVGEGDELGYGELLGAEGQ